MNLSYNSRLQPGSMKFVSWANRKLSSLAERIAEKYPEYFGYECKNPAQYPSAGHLYERSTTSAMMTWTSTGLGLWPAACYLPKAKMMNFNNYDLAFNTNSCIIKSSDDEIFYILPEKFDDWQKLPEMTKTECILFIEDKLPKFIDELIKNRLNIDKMLKEKEIREAAAKYD